MAASALLFAFMGFFARLATASTSWATVGAARALVGAAVALGFARLRGVSLRGGRARDMWLRSLFGTGAMMCTFYALSSRALPLGDTVTLLNSTPVLLALVAPVLLGERTTGAGALGIAIALAGVVLVAQPPFLFHTPHAAAPPGGPSAGVTAAFAIAAASFTALAMTMLRRVGRTTSPEAVALHFSLVAAAAMIAVSLTDPKIPTARDAAAMMAAGLCAGVGQLTMTRAYASERAARVGGMSYLSVVVSAALGAAVLGEIPSKPALLGMALVITGGVVLALRDKSAAR
jgi:drug/metabolite transporter (DMT)-like permease